MTISQPNLRMPPGGGGHERTLANLLRSLNRHLPAVRKTLAELLREEKPAIIGRDKHNASHTQGRA